MTIIGIDVYGNGVFQSPSPPIRNVNKIIATNAVFDELHLKEDTNNNLSIDKSNWDIDTRLRALFNNTLEAGNVQNDGMPIEKFIVKRRKVSDINNIKLSEVDFTNNETIDMYDYSQSNDYYVYSIVPYSQGIEGKSNEVQIESDFTGWYVLDKETNTVLSFDKFIGSDPDVNMSLNQGRTQINTLSKFPTIFYTEQNFHEFQLQAVFLPSEWERTGKDYENILNQFINQHRPFIVKSGNGELYVADISQPQKSSPMNTWKGNDYFTLTITCTEIQDYEEYMEE